MSSGNKVLLINPLERALSSDINRLQALAAQDRSEMMRYLLDCSGGTDDLDAAGGTLLQTVAATSPATAEILNGFGVVFGVGSTNVTVEPGAMHIVDVDTSPSADDSVYRFISDPGVPAAGTLVMTAGAGSIRIDVVECQRLTPDTVLSTDNRDIFNPVTGTFTATNVTKSTAARLTYRIRTGTPGAGYPGSVAGWLPLAVVSVPIGAATWDVCTMWDVRPLIADRIFQPMNASLARPRMRKNILNMTNPSATTGLFEVDYGSRRLGGRARRGSPGLEATPDSVDFTATANREAGFTPVANQAWFIYLLVPYGLPRWARYTDFSTGIRKPASPRGMLIASMVPPDSDGNASASISFPSVYGFSGGTTSGVCVGAGYTRSDGGFNGCVGNNDDGYILTDTGGGAAVAFNSPFQVAATGTSNTGTSNRTASSSEQAASFTLTAGTHFPAHARALLIEPRWVIPVSAGVAWGGEYQRWLQVFLQNAGSVAYTLIAGSHATPTVVSASGPTNVNIRWPSTWIVIPPMYPTLSSNYTIRIDAFMDLIQATNPTSAVIRVLGWKF